MGTVVPAQGLFRVASAGLCARSNQARRSASAAASRSSSHSAETLNSGRPIRTASSFRSRASVELSVIDPSSIIGSVNVAGGGPFPSPQDFGLPAQLRWRSVSLGRAKGDHRGVADVLDFPRPNRRQPLHANKRGSPWRAAQASTPHTSHVANPDFVCSLPPRVAPTVAWFRVPETAGATDKLDALPAH